MIISFFYSTIFLRLNSVIFEWKYALQNLPPGEKHVRAEYVYLWLPAKLSEPTNVLFAVLPMVMIVHAMHPIVISPLQ